MQYNSVNRYLKEKYGRKIYKIAIDGGFTCPTRDGTKGFGGCIFCSQYGSGDYAGDRKKSIYMQIEEGKNKVKKKINDDEAKYIAYFQAFTSTYDSVDILEELYMEAINHPDIVGVSIGTRPDCLGKDIIDLLDRLNRIKPIWVELGLQTIHDESAKYIRRGFSLGEYDVAVNNLYNIGIEQIITHLIVGLPFEDKEMILDSVRYVNESKSNGIKLQLLHVLENTDLADEYRNNKFKLLSQDEYTDIIVDALNILDDDMIVHRVTGDGNRKELVGPLWSLHKWDVLNEINSKLKGNISKR